jgi:hypothetical protein
MRTYTRGSRLEAAALISLATLAIGLGLSYAFLTTGNAFADSAPVTITIHKFVGGVPATASTSASTDFPMLASYTIAGTPGGPSAFALSASGYNGDPTPYRAKTVGLMTGDSYSVSEDTSGAIGLQCSTTASTTPRFALVGYTTGNTYAQATAATPSMTVPNFHSLWSDKYVIVWDRDCTLPTTSPPVATSSKTVTIDKLIDGVHASATNAHGTGFLMNASWADSAGTSSGQFTLQNSNTPAPYQAQTAALSHGASYATSEVIDGATVGTMCSTTSPTAPHFALVGYSSGNTYAQALAATPTTTAPAFTGINSNKYVIVWNHDCSISSGQISGTVLGDGSDGTLAVTHVDAVDTSASSDGTFTHGWRFVFDITAPSSEQDLSMRFADWLRTGGGGTIPAGSNMRISSAEADNGGATILVSAANTYTPDLHLIGDLSTTTIGRQVRVTVEVSIPAGTPDGSYTTSYGVRTN